jgi:hypothetical protein
MITQTVDSNYFMRRARQIKAQMPIFLSQWSLLSKFKRWRLAQDPGSGMVVLFGELNNRYIATHTTAPFSDYFDPRLMRDLAAELNVEVISSSNDGLRYAFVLERGRLSLPQEIHAPVAGGGMAVPPITSETLEPGVDQTLPEVVQEELIETRTAPTPLIVADIVEGQTLVDQGFGTLLKVFEESNLKDDAALPPTFQDPPDVVDTEAEKLINE